MNNAIETFVDFLKHLGDLGIDIGLSALEKRFGVLEEDELVVRMVNGTVVCHAPVPVIEKKIVLGIYTYLLISTCLGSVYSLNFNIITSVVVLYVIHIDVIES